MLVYVKNFHWEHILTQSTAMSIAIQCRLNYVQRQKLKLLRGPLSIPETWAKKREPGIKVFQIKLEIVLLRVSWITFADLSENNK